jgi:predicted MPP superfamily phosphohydrolase
VRNGHWSRWLIGTAGLALASAGALAAWGVLVEPRLVQTQRIDAWLPRLPADWEGQHLALLGDLQIGAPLANTDAVQRAVARVIASRPAAALLAGDYVYDLARQPAAIIDDLLRLLRPLVEAGVPSLGVLGNHDFAPEDISDPRQRAEFASRVEAALESLGIRILRNEALALPSPGRQPLYVVGLGERAAGEDAGWRAAFEQLPADAPRVVLAHDPAALQHVPAGWAPLALAGHTHGGQIRVPGHPAWAPARWRKPWPEYVDGWINGFLRPGNRLYVNRGIGFSRLPIRFGAPPEVTLITLHRPPTRRA